MSTRVYNFNPGPAALPLPVLEEAQAELLDFQGIGMSVMEISHRSKEYLILNEETEKLFKELLKIPDNYRVLFLQGGASTQFAMVPLNFLTPAKTAAYILSGGWSAKAYAEAAQIGAVQIAASSKETNYKQIPNLEDLQLSAQTAYVHLTSNNTLYGTAWQEFPDLDGHTLVADMSSDILSRPFDASKFGLIYAGAQKNAGPSGVTIVIIKQELLETANQNIPTILQYPVHVKNDSLYNTPPAFSVYMVNLVLKWLKAQGGLAKMAELNQEKASYIYAVIDESNGFYQGHAQKASRSLMNITFTLANEALEKAFVSEATNQNLIGLKGHRSVGGIRASTYNAVPKEACVALAEFMKDFQRRNG